MEYINLGNTGLKVSSLTLGCMSFGVAQRGPHEWTLDEDASRDIIKQALDAGITTFDTANVYSAGSSEEIVGRALADFTTRDDVVIATKLYSPMRPGPYGGGLSRKAILAETDNSLRRLGTDYIDLQQIHRWDYDTPIEETMEALHDVVKAGKVRYIGASSMFAWQFAKALHTAELGGWTRFISMQNHYNLLYRGIIPWSPLARGRLTRPWDTQTARAETDAFGRTLYSAGDQVIVERVLEIADKRGVAPAEVALSWVASRTTSPIVGVTKPSHLSDAVKALELTLDVSEVDYLQEPYQPHQVAGFV
jgi:aryl-alcohol dehydrogenase (NADP+)